MREFDLTSRRSTIIYGSEFPEYREEIRKGIMQGKMEVSLDYSRTSWSADSPEDSVIYRIRLIEKESVEERCLMRVRVETSSGRIIEANIDYWEDWGDGIKAYNKYERLILYVPGNHLVAFECWEGIEEYGAES